MTDIRICIPWYLTGTRTECVTISGDAALPDLTDWAAWREFFGRVWGILSCKLLGGCLFAVQTVYPTDLVVSDMPFARDVSLIAASYGFVCYAVPCAVSARYRVTLWAFDKVASPVVSRVIKEVVQSATKV